MRCLRHNKKGERCKINIPSDKKYCHYHQWQDARYTRAPRDNAQNKPGFIYIYTYSNLFESYISEKTVDLKWLFIDESIIRTNGKKKRQWVDRDFILCKIGMTTRKTVDSRLLEWQTTCKHPVINLTPEKVDKLYHLKLKSESKNISSNRLLPISLSSLQKKWRNFSSKIKVTHTSLPFQILRCQPFALIKMVDFSLAEKVQ